MTVYAIAATGTGGHIFPALSVARALHSQGHEIVWFGSENGLESKYLKGFNYVPLPCGPVVGKSNQVSRIMALLKCVPKVQEQFMRYSIEKTIVFGGYVSLPVGLAAKGTKTRLFVHEQNAKPGRANRILVPLAEKVFTAYPGIVDGRQNKEVVTGNPLRFKPEWITPKNVLVFGGSQGSGILNKLMLGVVKNSSANFHLVVGARHMQEVAADYAGIKNVEIYDFIEDMQQEYLWADAVIGRAGALTISEARAMALPMLLIPLANSADDHQVKNAMGVIGHSEVMFESDVSESGILYWLKNGPKSALERILDYV